ncbi:hypothetical protein HK096_010570, partial [Nowakowskiella sp. JEL0078]
MPEHDILVEFSIQNSSLSPSNSQASLQMVGFTPHPVSTVLADERILKSPTGRPLDPTPRFPLTRITMPTSTSSPVSRTNPHNIQYSIPPIPQSRAFSQEPTEMFEILRQRRKPRSGGGTQERLRRIVAGAESDSMRDFLKEWARDAGNSIEQVVTKNPAHSELEVTAVTVVSANGNSVTRSRKRSMVTPEFLIDPPIDLSLAESKDPPSESDSSNLFSPHSNIYQGTKISSSYSNENITKNHTQQQQQLDLIHTSTENINKPLPVPPMLVRIRPKHPNMKLNYRKSIVEMEEYSSDDDVVVYEYESDEDIEGDETLENHSQGKAVRNKSTEDILDEIGGDDSKEKPRKTWTAFFNPVMKTL